MSIKELAKEVKNNDIYFIAENSEKYISFSVALDDIETDIEQIDNDETNEESDHDKSNDENDKNETDEKTISYTLKFINSFRFMSSSLDSRVNNLSEIDKKTFTKCQERNKTIQICEFIKLKENKLVYKCKNCNN